MKFRDRLRKFFDGFAFVLQVLNPFAEVHYLLNDLLRRQLRPALATWPKHPRLRASLATATRELRGERVSDERALRPLVSDPRDERHQSPYLYMIAAEDACPTDAPAVIAALRRVPDGVRIF